MNLVIWNLKIRLLHWLMALFVILNLFVFDEGNDVHFWIGYGALALILIRVFIGFRSNGYEAFKKFPLNLSELVNFLKNLFRRDHKDYVGHNPAAAYAYISFWILVVTLGFTGVLLVHVDTFWGDQLLEEIHNIAADCVIVFIVIHFTGILLDSILHKRKAWISMITGFKS